MRKYSQIRRWPQIPDHTGKLSHFTEELPVISCLHFTLYLVLGLVTHYLFSLQTGVQTMRKHMG